MPKIHGIKAVVLFRSGVHEKNKGGGRERERASLKRERLGHVWLLSDLDERGRERERLLTLGLGVAKSYTTRKLNTTNPFINRS